VTVNEATRSQAGEARLPPTRTPKQRRLTLSRPVPGGPFIGPALLLLTWGVASAIGLLDPRLLPPPTRILESAITLANQGRLGDSLLASGWRALQGFALGLAVGTLLALIAGLSRWGEAIVDGPIQIKRAIPTLAIIPLLMLWLGIGETMKVITIATGVAVPVYIQTYSSLRAVDRRYVELAQTLGIGTTAFILEVMLPAAMPGFFLGVRFGVTYAWLSLIVVEQVNSTSGLGYMIELARSYGQTDIVIVGVCIYGLLGFATDYLIRLIERSVVGWRRTLDT
jgi:sulfonate transport system permease protein